MNTSDDVEWLVAEVQDLLGAGRVGLYEFVWLLRPHNPAYSSEEMRALSRRALERLRERDDVRLVQFVWPGFDIVGRPDWSELGDDAWDDIGDGPYYAIVRPDELDRPASHA